MRIAYVTETYPPELNGVSLSVERAVRFLRDRGHALQLIRPRQRGEFPRDDEHEWRTFGLPIPMYPDLRFGLAATWTLAKRFERYRPEVVHITTQGPLGRAALMAARQLRIPLTTDFRTNFHSYSQYYRLGWLKPTICNYLRAFHNRAERTFVPSRTIKNELAAAGFLRLDVVGRGVDSQLFSPAKRDDRLRASWGVTDEDQLVLLYVGRLAREKNVALALRSLDMIRYVRPNTRMIVVGDGPLRQELQNDFPAAQFVGVKQGEELARYYASGDLFVFPSESETFGNVTLEAMASALAVIAFNGAAAADLISHGYNGVVVAHGDENAFVETVCRFAALGTEVLAPLREHARQTALGANWDRVLTGFENHLAQTVYAKNMEQSRHVIPA